MLLILSLVDRDDVFDRHRLGATMLQKVASSSGKEMVRVPLHYKFFVAVATQAIHS
jgi:phosphoglucomutase